MNYEIVAKNIRAELKSYLQTSGLKSLVLGISGGIDSTLCVALAKPVCDELGVKLIGRSITIESNKDDERHRADLVGNAFCHDYKEVNLTDEYNTLNDSFYHLEGAINEDIADKIRKGNIKARIRMIYLYNIAQINGGMVLSTDNYTELMLSYFTLHGDVGDYGMVQNLWKTEVYDLSRWIAENECESGQYTAIMDSVRAIPTDGLGITDSDLEQIGASSYNEVDDILQSHFRDNTLYIDHPVITRHYASEFKRTNPYNIPRDIIV